MTDAEGKRDEREEKRDRERERNREKVQAATNSLFSVVLSIERPH